MLCHLARTQTVRERERQREIARITWRGRERQTKTEGFTFILCWVRFILPSSILIYHLLFVVFWIMWNILEESKRTNYSVWWKMKFCKKYREYMQGQDKKLPGLGFKKLKKMLKNCRSDLQSGNGIDGVHDSQTCPDHCPGNLKNNEQF